MINPYFDPDKLDLEMLSFDEPDMAYEYNTLCFWATKDGQVYTASDSGCSCPTPFECYEGETPTDVLQNLERVGSVEQAMRTFDEWNKDYNNRPHLGHQDRVNAETWVRDHLQ